MKYIKTYNISLIIFLLIGILSCHDTKPTFDFESWKEDENACLKKRATLFEEYKQISNYLMKKSGKEIIALLGNPDIIELNKRHIKTYIYFIDQKESKCNELEENSTKLSRASCIEFNSIGRVSVISMQMR